MKKFKNKIIPVVLSTVLLVGSLVGCGQQPPLKENTNFSPTNKMNIVVTSFVLYDFARQVGGENAKVTMITGDDSDIFNYEYGNKDIEEVNSADMFIYLGSDAQPWVDDLLSDSKITNTNYVLCDTSESINTNKTDRYNINKVDEYSNKTLEELFKKNEEESTQNSETSTDENSNGGTTSLPGGSIPGLNVPSSYIDYDETPFIEEIAAIRGTTNNMRPNMLADVYQMQKQGTLFLTFNGTDITAFNRYPGGHVFDASSVAEINEKNTENQEICYSQKAYDYLMGNMSQSTGTNTYKCYWLNINNVETMVNNILNSIGTRDPNNKTTYSSNAETYLTSITRLKERYDNLISNSSYNFITITGKFRYYYLIDGLKLNYVSVYDTENNDEAPALSRQANMSSFIKTNNLQYVITDESSDQSITNAICTDTGVQALVFNTMVNIPKSDFNKEGITYYDIMSANYDALKYVIK